MVGARKCYGSRSRAARIRQLIVESSEWREPSRAIYARKSAAMGGFCKRPHVGKGELAVERTGL